MEIKYKPIAFFKSSHSETYEAPRQGVLADDSYGEICFEKEINFDCFSDLEGFDRIWVIYDFHENKSWKPKVRPPRFSEKKRSVLSSRSPYRPNSVGISCVKLIRVEKNKLVVSGHDILDQSPVLDVKPYLPYSDSFQEVQTGWVEEDKKPFNVHFNQNIIESLEWLSKEIDINLAQLITNQLSYEPTNSKSKRVKKELSNSYVLSVRTWRFDFKIDDQQVQVSKIYSGYSDEDFLRDGDEYNDKEIHKNFIKKFS